SSSRWAPGSPWESRSITRSVPPHDSAGVSENVEARTLLPPNELIRRPRVPGRESSHHRGERRVHLRRPRAQVANVVRVVRARADPRKRSRRSQPERPSVEDAIKGHQGQGVPRARLSGPRSLPQNPAEVPRPGLRYIRAKIQQLT